MIYQSLFCNKVLQSSLTEITGFFSLHIVVWYFRTNVVRGDIHTNIYSLFKPRKGIERRKATPDLINRLFTIPAIPTGPSRDERLKNVSHSDHYTKSIPISIKFNQKYINPFYFKISLKP